MLINEVCSGGLHRRLLPVDVGLRVDARTNSRISGPEDPESPHAHRKGQGVARRSLSGMPPPRRSVGFFLGSHVKSRDAHGIYRQETARTDEASSATGSAGPPP